MDVRTDRSKLLSLMPHLVVDKTQQRVANHDRKHPAVKEALRKDRGEFDNNAPENEKKWVHIHAWPTRLECELRKRWKVTKLENQHCICLHSG